MSRRAFTSMGCEVVVAGGTARQRLEAERLFHLRDARFSRFGGDSELNRVNAASAARVVVSEDFARGLRHALSASSATRGLVTPAVGAALLAAGYDRSSERLQPDARPVGPPPSADPRPLRLAGRLLERPPELVLDLNGVVKSLTVDDALALLDGPAWVSAGGDLACRGGLDVALPDGDAVRLRAGGLATSGTGKRRWLRGGAWQHHLIDPRTSLPSKSPWLDVTVCSSSCLRADVAAKAAFLLGHEGPDWLHGRGLAGRFRGEDGVIVETAAWHVSVAAAA